jgi:hypothetical protein
VRSGRTRTDDILGAVSHEARRASLPLVAFPMRARLYASPVAVHLPPAATAAVGQRARAQGQRRRNGTRREPETISTARVATAMRTAIAGGQQPRDAVTVRVEVQTDGQEH